MNINRIRETALKRALTLGLATVMSISLTACAKRSIKTSNRNNCRVQKITIINNQGKEESPIYYVVNAEGEKISPSFKDEKSAEALINNQTPKENNITTTTEYSKTGTATNVSDESTSELTGGLLTVSAIGIAAAGVVSTLIKKRER